MSRPEDSCRRRRRLSTPIGVGWKSSSWKYTLICHGPDCDAGGVANGRGFTAYASQQAHRPALAQPRAEHKTAATLRRQTRLPPQPIAIGQTIQAIDSARQFLGNGVTVAQQTLTLFV